MAFVLSCYTGLRWVDVKNLKWSDIKGNTLVTRIIQKKTDQPVTLTLHTIAKAILEKKRRQLEEVGMDTENCCVFSLPTQDGCNKSIEAVDRQNEDQ
jgi:integrase